MHTHRWKLGWHFTRKPVPLLCPLLTSPCCGPHLFCVLHVSAGGPLKSCSRTQGPSARTSGHPQSRKDIYYVDGLASGPLSPWGVAWGLDSSSKSSTLSLQGQGGDTEGLATQRPLSSRSWEEGTSPQKVP